MVSLRFQSVWAAGFPQHQAHAVGVAKMHSAAPRLSASMPKEPVPGDHIARTDDPRKQRCVSKSGFGLGPEMVAVFPRLPGFLPSQNQRDKGNPGARACAQVQHAHGAIFEQMHRGHLVPSDCPAKHPDRLSVARARKAKTHLSRRLHFISAPQGPGYACVGNSERCIGMSLISLEIHGHLPSPRPAWLNSASRIFSMVGRTVISEFRTHTPRLWGVEKRSPRSLWMSQKGWPSTKQTGDTSLVGAEARKGSLPRSPKRGPLAQLVITAKQPPALVTLRAD